MYSGIHKIRLLRRFIGLILAGTLLWLMFREQDRLEIVQAISGIDLLIIAGSLALIGASQLLRIVRWWWMLRRLNTGIPLAACIRPYLMSTAVNNLLPFRAGDVYRVLGFRQQLGVSGSQVLGTLIGERLLDLLILSSFLLMGLYGLAGDTLPVDIVESGIMISLVVIMMSFGGVILFPSLQRLLIRIGRKSCSNQILQLTYALGSLRSPIFAIQLLGISLLSWNFSAVVYGAISFAITESVDVRGAWFSLATANFGVLLPGAPASIGTFDYFAALGLVAYGASRSAAVAFALTMHILLWVPTTLAGAVCFLWGYFFPSRDNKWVGA